MAHIEKIEGKRGTTYRFIVSGGFDTNGKRITHKKTWKPPEGMTARAFAIKKISKNAPLLLKRHKGDISTVLAAIKGQTVDEYVASLNMAALSIDLLELLNDKEFVSFFMSVDQTTGSSGDASETTEAPAQ